MPLLNSTYRAPVGFSKGHVQTVWPALLRHVKPVAVRRERIDTPDGDFLDLDFATQGSDRAVIISHGLEGSSRQAYVRGMVWALFRRGWDVVAWNFRGCSGEPNRLLRSYHSGATEDLRVVADHVLKQTRYERVGLVGFSLGGNLTLKFLGEDQAALDPRFWRAVAFSVPCDLAASAGRLAHFTNRIYMIRFLRTLVGKLREKSDRFPGAVDLAGVERMRTFAEFDDRFTAPIHGFAGANDYWRRCSSRQFLPKIRIPTLLVNARNDPFLTPSCFPFEEARANPQLSLEVPDSGGHVGFVSFGLSGEYWSERRAAGFLEAG